MKATLRNGKGSATHNDRTYNEATEEEKEEVILIKKAFPECDTLEENEIACFNELYGKWLKRQNERYIRKGNYDRVKSMEKIVGGPNKNKNKGRYEPTETILQIGKNGEEIHLSVLKSCLGQYMRKMHERYGSNMKFLDFAIHKEKSSVYHVHIRRTWFYKDEEGIICPGKKEALRQLGIEVKDATRYENATKLQTAEERAIWYSIIKAHGINIDEIADLDNAEHQAPREYKRQAKARSKYEAEQKERIQENAHILSKQTKEITKNNNRIIEQEIKITEGEKKEKQLGIIANDREASIDDIINASRW